MTKSKKILSLVSKIFFNVMAIVLGLFLIVGSLLKNKDVEALLTTHVFKDKPEDIVVSTGKEPVRYKTWYSSVLDLVEGNGEIGWMAQAEGTVLLQNEGGALPLAEGDKVSIYGVTGYDPMYCLDGAGNNKINDTSAYNGKSELDRRQFFYDEFEDAGLVMNESLKNWYNSDAGKHYRRADKVGFWGLSSGLGYGGNENGKLPALTEARWGEIDTAAKDYGNFGKDTTAVYITGRMSNESTDLNSEGAGESVTAPGGNSDGSYKDVDYLAFTPDEKDLLKALGENYSKVVVIFNQANPPQENIPDILEEYGIEAALWIGFPGSDGIKAVAQILTGKINPSGGLSAAWYASRNANPSTQNYGFNWDNIVNVEGMYVGYRYAETRYEDTLKGRNKAGTYDYGANVSYPFGYGLSYADFSITSVDLVKDEDPSKNYYGGGVMAANDKNYGGNRGEERPPEERRATGENLGDCDDLIMKVTVHNDSTEYAGKKAVQVYVSQPITETDIAHGVEKPAVQLIGYGKTGVIAPGEDGEVEIEIDANKWFASYDSRLEDGDGNIVGGYVLSMGDYKLAAAFNSHEAVNSIFKDGGGSEDNAAFNGDYGAGSASNVKTVSVDGARSESYRYWTQGTSDDVHNLFSDIDPNMDDSASNDIVYFSRYDWEKTAAVQGNGRLGASGRYTTGGASGKTNGFSGTKTLESGDVDKFADYYGVTFDDTKYTFGWSDTEWQLVDLIGVEYDPARGASEEDIKKWDELVGQMEVSDFDRLFSAGLRKTMSVPSIGKPGTNDQNASNGFEWAVGKGNGDRNGDFESRNADYGFRSKFTPNSKIVYPTGYPCEGIVAASFNNEVAYRVGQAMGEDALWAGASGLYGFGLGMQRNPYHGRAGEFYSDDSFLTGMMGGYSSLGAQEKGLYVYNKHFVLNDQDTNRSGYHSWLSEQTLRQIYLRPFEMAIEIGDAMNVMIAFNKLGDAWTGSNYNLMTRWLRGEAGMAGFAISDYAPSPGENIGYGMLSGACLLDGDTNGGYSINCDNRYNNRLVEAAKRILYTVANSNAMNFWGDDTRTYSFDAPWLDRRDAALGGGGIAVYVLFAVSCAFLLAMKAWEVVDTVRKKD